MESPCVGLAERKEGEETGEAEEGPRERGKGEREKGVEEEGGYGRWEER